MKNNVTLFDRFPIFAFILPVVGGFFAWQFSGMIEIGLFLLIAGLITNGYFVYSRRKLRQKNPKNP